MAQLIVVEGPNRGTTYHLNGGLSTLGRGADCTIVLGDRRASELQSEIRQHRDIVEIVNLDTRRHLLVNGEVKERSRLQPGDWIKIADTTLVFSEDPQHRGPELSLQDIPMDDSGASIMSRRKAYLDTDSVIETFEPAPDESRLAVLFRVSSTLINILDPGRLYEKTLDILFQLFPVERAFVLLVDEEKRVLRPVATRGPDGEPLADMALSRTILREVYHRREAILSTDAWDDERFLMGQSVMEQSIRSVLCAPVLADRDHMLGIIQLDASEAEAFDEGDLDMLNAVAMQTAVALKNCQAYQKHREHNRNLIFLGQATQRLSSFLEKDKVLKEVTKEVCRLLSCTKSSCMMVKGDRFTIPYAVGIPRELYQKLDRRKLGNRLAKHVLRLGKPLLAHDVGDLPDELAHVEPEPRYDTRSCLLVPIWTRAPGFVASGRELTVGVLCAADKTNGGRFSGNDLEMMQILARQTGIALANSELYEKATVDGLTRVYVRRYLFQALEETIEAHQRQKQDLSLLLLDIDHFKRINDTYGHPAGDSVLRTLGWLLKRSLRAEHTVARYGGEEFVIILSDTDLKIACKIAERLRERVEATFVLPEAGRIHLTVSVGVSQLAPGDSVDSLVKKADMAMYKAKNGGRNRVEVYRA